MLSHAITVSYTHLLEEGRHTLEVKAIDAAGNTGTAKARFVIDHTPPQVVFQDVEDGKDYEEEKTFQVTLEDQEDQIDEIKINGEVQKTNKRSRIYQFTVQDLKNYEIEVKASDYAGNQAVGHIQFQEMCIRDRDDIGRRDHRRDPQASGSQDHGRDQAKDCLLYTSRCV